MSLKRKRWKRLDCNKWNENIIALRGRRKPLQPLLLRFQERSRVTPYVGCNRKEICAKFSYVIRCDCVLSVDPKRSLKRMPSMEYRRLKRNWLAVEWHCYLFVKLKSMFNDFRLLLWCDLKIRTKEKLIQLRIAMWIVLPAVDNFPITLLLCNHQGDALWMSLEKADSSS